MAAAAENLAELYERVWAHDAYRKDSPGELAVTAFLRAAEPRQDETLWDLGCGSGRAGARLAELGLRVTQFDFAENCRDPDIDLPFRVHDLTQPLPGRADYAYCCDVLEHVRPEDAPKVLEHVVCAGKRAYLQISTVPDKMGALFGGAQLHLTVWPVERWREELERLDCRILWEAHNEVGCAFYVSAYADAREVAENAVLNVTSQRVRDNVRKNLEGNYREVAAYEPTDATIMLLAGGPSLAEYEDEIREKRRAGMPLVTVNGAYNWCLDRGILPSMQIVVDARPFNTRFVQPAIERCWYMIASQCDPAVAAALPHDQVYMWHSGAAMRPDIEEYDALVGRSREWWPVWGGSTVTLRALPLLTLLGFRRMSIFGWDSCLFDDRHHAYAQPENDKRVWITVNVGGREFRCNPWMAAQASDFVGLMKYLAGTVELDVRGPGLIAAIIEHAANTSEEP